MELISAQELREKQSAYIKEVNDNQINNIIKLLSEAYKSHENYIIVDKINDINIQKLRQEGYNIKYEGTQKEGYYYKICW